ncbi:T9SS type A sorting domain-containing protein [candidate division KSB1 bacterium]|nr:T9SS type A sorting domain-containing protein [candidate division KSB1 bacterium]
MNPGIAIEFDLPKSAFVTLRVYNLLGEEVGTLLAEQKSAGIHKINWDARGLASGMYLCRMDAIDPSAGSGQDFVQSKKLVLMR